MTSQTNILFLLLISIMLFSCNDKVNEQNWHKGNLHTHSLWSDGDDFPEMIIQWYKDHHYQFIALSDHNTIANSEYWYELKDRDLKNKSLEKYQKRFGDWVETKIDSNKKLVRLKRFDEFRSKLEEKDSFIVIKSEEVTSSFERKPIHINVTNIQDKIEPIKGSSVIEVMQKTLDVVHQQRERLNVPMFAHINHPNFGYGIDVEDMKKLNGERFFELFNGHPSVNNEGDEDHIDMETMWDLINIHYYENGKPLLYGVATDDSHNYHSLSADLSNTGRGWVMVNAEELTPAALIAAMEEGDFYASTGIHLKKVFANNEKISVEIAPQLGVNYEIVFMGYREGSDEVVALKRVVGTSASYAIQNNDIFVRANVNSDALKESPPLTKETKKAWTQPFLVH